MTTTSGAARNFTTGESEMMLYLVYTIDKLRTDNLTFFRMAHFRMFGTDPDLSNDVAQFVMHGIIPKYVQAYLRILQES